MHNIENKLYEDPLYILTNHDLEKIDGLILSLNLAITEIMQSRAVKVNPLGETPFMDAFNEKFYEIIEQDQYQEEP